MLAHPNRFLMPSSFMNESEQARVQQIDEEIGRLERDYAHREAYGDAGPKLQQLLRTIAILRHEREALTSTHIQS